MSKLPQITGAKRTISTEEFLQKIESNSWNSKQMIDAIFDDRALAKVRSADGSCLLHHAVLNEYPALLKFLCGQAVAKKKLFRPELPNINWRDESGSPALHYAIGGFSGVDTVKLLCDLGADVDIADAKGQTSLHHAVACNRHDLIGLICSKTKNINARNIEGHTPRDIASTNSNKVIVSFLDEFAQNPTILAVPAAPLEIKLPKIGRLPTIVEAAIEVETPRVAVDGGVTNIAQLQQRGSPRELV